VPVKRSPAERAAAAAPTAPADTRGRLLEAALLLFRQRGYHGVSDILALAGAPRGSLYHHFPGGKDQVAVEVLELVTRRLEAMLSAEPGATTAELMLGVGMRLRKWMRETSPPASGAGSGAEPGGDPAHSGGSACALIASFAAEGDTAVAVATAARRAYERIAAVIAGRLEAEGLPPRAARETALLAIATLEGGGLVSQTLGEPRLFLAAIERAAALCQAPARKVPS
jgi:TetR/AcrR family transcriptional repressor of lmrAB and yxaGH operons